MARNAKIMDAVTVDNTTNATKYSQPFSMQYGTVGSLHFEWTGTPTSTITLWESNKGEKPGMNPSTSSDADWVQNTDITFTGPAGGASKGLYNFGNAGARWYRVKVVTSAGSGTFTCWANYAKLV